MKATASTALILLSLVTGSSCSFDPINIEGKTCPCPSGYVCDPTTSTCTKTLKGSDASSDASTHTDASLDSPTESGADAPSEDSAAETSSDSGTVFRRTLTIPAGKVSEDLKEFPLLVYLPKTGASGIANENNLRVMAGTKELPHEVDQFFASIGAIWFWVRVPVISASSETVLILEYGPGVSSSKTESVFKDYSGVWHFGDWNPPLAQDSSGHLRPLAYTEGKPASDGSGAIGRCISLDGYTALAAASTSAWDMTAAGLTLSIWFKAGKQSPLPLDKFHLGFARFFDRFSGVGPKGFYFGFDRKKYNDPDSGGILGSELGTTGISNGAKSLTNFDDDKWHHSTLVIHQGKVQLYGNGVLLDSKNWTGTPINVTGKPLRIGNDGSSTNGLKGKLDEARVLQRALNQAWVAAEYKNQSNPANFVTVSPILKLP